MTVTTTASLIWFLGFAALTALAVTATIRARARGQHLEGRGGLLAAAALLAATCASGAWAFGIAPAAEGAERRARAGIDVELAIEQLDVALPGARDATLTVGFANGGDHAHRDDLRHDPRWHLLPGTGPTELVRVSRAAPDAVGAPAAAAASPGQPPRASWRVEAAAGVALVQLPSSGQPPTLRQRLALADACARPPGRGAPAAASLALPLAPADASATAAAAASAAASDPRFTVAAVVCGGKSPWRAVLLGGLATAGGARLTFAPLAGPRWLSPRLTAAAGSLLHIDGGDAQLPGLRTWNVGGERAGWLLAIPEDPRDCSGWRDASAAPFPGGCRLRRGGLVVRATPLVPDVGGVERRAGLAAVVIGAPALLSLLGLALARGSRRRTAQVAPVLALAALAAGLAALLEWRLLWAHRIDLLREVAVASWRVADNLRAAALVGACVAGLAASVAVAAHRPGRALWCLAPLLAWSAWLVGAAALCQLAGAPVSWPASPALGFSLAASILLALAPALALAARDWPAWQRRRAGLTAAHALAVIAVAAIAGKLLAPKLVLLKLSLAYGIVVAGQAALATAVRAETSPARRLSSIATTALAALTMLAFDGGVALAIAGVGLLGAMIMAGHDAMYGEAAAARLGLLEREHARILAAYAAAAAVLALALVGWGWAAGDRLLIEHTADLVLHIPLAVAALFVLGGLLARRHGQPWAPWLAAALAALALWGGRQPVLERMMAGDGVSAHRVSAVLDPGYALLRDERRFMAQTSAWQAATLPEPSGDAALGDGAEPLGSFAEERATNVRFPDEATAAPPSASAARWAGQGLTGSRVADPGVARSIDNDYLPVLVARELGVAGLLRAALFLFALLVGAGALASARLPHASDGARARTLVLTVAGALVLYQPLAALGILPLTGISWPGLGIDSPADLWIACAGLVWCALVGAMAPAGTASEEASLDERVRAAPRLRRARAAIALASACAGVASVALVARAGDSALGRAALRRGSDGSGDPRVDRAIAYARTLRCGAPASGPSAATPLAPAAPLAPATPLEPLAPLELRGAPSDATTRRFHRELLASWEAQRGGLERGAAAPACAGRFERWRFERGDDDVCRATFDAGWPQIRVELRDRAPISCKVDVPGDPIAQLLQRPAPSSPRLRLVSRAMGDAASDVGELLIGGAVIRLRPGAPALRLDELAGGPPLRLAGEVQLGATAALQIVDGEVRVRGRTRAWVSAAATSDAPAAWLPVQLATAAAPAATTTTAARKAGASTPASTPTAAPAALDRITLLVGDGDAPRAALFRPRRAWPAAPGAPITPGGAADGAATVDPLLADDVLTIADRPRRTYPFGAALPQLGWVNPYAVERSLGLDGWAHAALAAAAPAAPTSCGTLSPPAIPAASVCSRSPLDGVLECRVSLQPELTLALAAKTAALLDEDRPLPAKAATPIRASFVVLRGDTGEIIAQSDATWRRAPSAYAPRTAADELTLVRLREDRDPQTGEPGEPGESERERVEWNQPIAVGSTLKPVVARAAELAFPQLAPELQLGFSGAVAQCKGRRGAGFAALLGHCPPTSLTGEPAAADLHDFLARSPNWYQAALGILGLGLPDGGFATGDQSRSLPELLGSDLSGWPTGEPLMIRDAQGPILGKRGVVIEGLRRAPLWRQVEALLGRPLCTLGDHQRCVAASARRDVCAARALPVPNPGADLRHLVALGPDRFDFYGDVRDPRRPSQSTVPTREYLQWLRGSGVYPVGSLSQLTDAFGRIIYGGGPDGSLAGPGGAGGAAPAPTAASSLAASWFPSPVAGALPTWQCQGRLASAGSALSERQPRVRGAGGGLCAVLEQGGTAHRATAALFTDPRLTLYGAKTGTVDSLAGVARNRASCEAWNRRHTVSGRPLALASQPGWLECGKAPPDDSLFVVAFSVQTPAGPVPVTLGLALQRAGKGTAARLAPSLITAIADYFDAAK